MAGLKGKEESLKLLLLQMLIVPSSRDAAGLAKQFEMLGYDPGLLKQAVDQLQRDNILGVQNQEHRKPGLQKK